MDKLFKIVSQISMLEKQWLRAEYATVQHRRIPCRNGYLVTVGINHETHLGVVQEWDWRQDIKLTSDETREIYDTLTLNPLSTDLICKLAADMLHNKEAEKVTLLPRYKKPLEFHNREE